MSVYCRVCAMPTLIATLAPARLCRICRSDVEATRSYILELDIPDQERSRMFDEVQAYEDAWPVQVGERRAAKQSKELSE